jgi:hypothetical protein
VEVAVLSGADIYLKSGYKVDGCRPGLASCHDADHRLSVGASLLLLRM